MSDDLLKRLDDAANDTHYIDHETAREAAARIRELEILCSGQEEQLEIQGNELCRRASRGHELSDIIRKLESDRNQGARDYCDLMTRHDAHFSAWQAAKTRAEEAEAQVERNAAIAFHALQRATLAEEWRDHDKTRAEAAEAALATARRDALDEAAKVADDHTPEKHSGLTLASHVTGRTIAAAIRAIAAGGAK